MAKTTSDLPTKVKVGFADYAIRPFEHLEGQSRERYGECSHARSLINIDVNHGTRKQAKTLLHEIMHAVAAIWDYSDHDKEEDAVQLFSLGIATVWRDNPEVFAWIGHHLVHGT
jgi:hypothetical protein